jgi:DNA modification methylase
MAEATILVGDVRKTLASLPDGSVRCVVTSPPYWGLRDYGNDGQIGLEQTPELYVAEMVEVFREVRRVLADDGTLWLNLGDSYKPAGNGSTKKGLNERYFGKQFASDKQGADEGHVDSSQLQSDGIKQKELVGIPWRVAFALQADGWYLRQDIIWAKPNPMPESVTDRCTKAHEYVFLLTKQPRYYYDADAVREPLSESTIRIHSSPNVRPRGNGGWKIERNLDRGDRHDTNLKNGKEALDEYIARGGRNRRSVWTVTSKPFRGAHFAVMPEALVEPCVLAGSAEGDTVLDPFSGSGTVGVVALRNGRNYIGCELNPDYADISRKRIADDQPLLNSVTVIGEDDE